MEEQHKVETKSSISDPSGPYPIKHGPTAFRLFLRHFQSFGAPFTLQTTAIYDPAAISNWRSRLPIAVLILLAGKLDLGLAMHMLDLVGLEVLSALFRATRSD